MDEISRQKKKIHSGDNIKEGVIEKGEQAMRSRGEDKHKCNNVGGSKTSKPGEEKAAIKGKEDTQGTAQRKRGGQKKQKLTKEAQLQKDRLSTKTGQTIARGG